MDTTELATSWQREGYLEVETTQVMPDVWSNSCARCRGMPGIIRAPVTSGPWLM
jgi:hypothetical protein